MSHDLSLPQDPNELFDIVLADGTPTGRSKRRADVHRDGDWHRAVHVWVMGIDDRGPFLMFQKRSLAKDTSPGKMDSTVGGHYRAGEGIEQTLREVEEEIGISVTMADLTYAGIRRAVNERDSGVADRELQDVFFLRDERPLTEFRPSPAELAALVRVPIEEFLDFHEGERETINVRSIAPGAAAEERLVIARLDFNRPADRYWYRVAIAAKMFLAGERHFSV
jgi:isopentenyldiphosphate isomerase